MNKMKIVEMLMVPILLIILAACGSEANNDDTGGQATTENGGQQSDELETISVALSPFQDVYSIHVGIEQGFFEEEGIELEIQETDWAGGNDLLVGEQVDVATAGDSDVVLQNSNGVETTLAFPIFYFAGAGLMYDDDRYDWQTYDQFLEEGLDQEEAMRETLEQVKGMRIGLNTSVSEYTSFISMLDYVGLESDDYEIIDMSQEDLPPALLSESIDVMISGIPQRLAVQKEGYATLIDQTTLPYTISHNGFAAHQSWVENNHDLSLRFLQAIFKTFHYIEENPNEAFPIIVERMKDVGTEITVEELKDVWNNMEYFPSSKEFYQNEVLDENGDFYWRDRFERVVGIMEAEGRVEEGSITNLESLHYTVELLSE
ncbi:ABC transporter substrate-binding protein [Gracilibacillus timonensis]|uniref:ABC transporter substrate-binding protein n=1 Tax=Gracilibacillus timonensis TaxID=1816696 RepID=UPI0008271D91|nr:ABC transporter substrate-binding protein [Gracilibacillus timonensis]